MTVGDARRLAIAAQRSSELHRHAEGILEVVRDIGYLQLDTDQRRRAESPARALDPVGRYDPALLEGLFAKRKLFETVCSSSRPAIWPSTRHDARISACNGPGRLRSGHGSLAGAGGGTWPSGGEVLAQNPQLRRKVLARLRREGPLPLTAFEDRAFVSWTSAGGTMSGTWDDAGDPPAPRRGRGRGAQPRRKLWALAGLAAQARAALRSGLEREATLRALRATAWRR